LIRAINVLRQYEEADFAPAYERLAQYVLPGGLMIEGTSNPFGSIWAANLVRKMDDVALSRETAKSLDEKKSKTLQSPDSSFRATDWKQEALVFSTNFNLGFDVEDFQTILPKNFIHHMIPGEAIYDFFEAWKRSAAETVAAKVYGPLQWFVASAQSLAGRGYKVNTLKKWLSKGWLIWEF
jgi:hypothetical protein